MGGEFSKDWGEKRCIQGFGWETWGKETTWKIRRRWEDDNKMVFFSESWMGAWTGLLWLRIGTDDGML